MERIKETLNNLGLKGLGQVLESQTEYTCLICHDRGWLHPTIDGKIDYGQVIRCRCRLDVDRGEKQRILLKLCALPAMTEHKTFDNFKTFNDRVLTEVFRYCREIANKSDSIRFLTMIAESGRGKSHMGIAICREWLSREEAAAYVNVPRMLNSLREGYSLEGEESFYRRLHFYSSVGLLVLDDFGTEKVTEWGAEQLQTIINSRYDDALYTVVTSNRPIDDLLNYRDYPKEQWRDYANMRIESRLKRESWCKVLLLDTKSYMERRK